MASTKTHDIKVKTGEWVDKAGVKKGRWLTVGRVMTGDDGSEFWLLDKTFNPAGVPDLTGKGGESVMLCKFAPRDAQADLGEHQQAKANGYAPQAASANSHGFSDIDNDLPF